MAASQFYKLGSDLARLSDSETWAHYVRLHPQTKIGFLHAASGQLYLMLTDRALGHNGVLRYADNVTELLEVAHDALFREGEIEVL
jgi:hypothetical protein